MMSAASESLIKLEYAKYISDQLPTQERITINDTAQENTKKLSKGK